jgi:hypothetical protein
MMFRSVRLACASMFVASVIAACAGDSTPAQRGDELIASRCATACLASTPCATRCTDFEGLSTTCGDEGYTCGGTAPSPSGTVSATPTVVQIASGSLGTTSIRWQVYNAARGDVYVSMDGAQQRLFASGTSGTQSAPWIQVGHTYDFRLYANGAYVNVVRVTGSACATTCNGACVDLTSNVNHCGACGNVCPSTAYGTRTCRAGVCGITCRSGYVYEAGRCVSLSCGLYCP